MSDSDYCESLPDRPPERRRSYRYTVTVITTIGRGAVTWPGFRPPANPEPTPDGPVQEIVTDGDGRTSVDGIWAAGHITGTHHQALVSAGDGARVALNLVEELVPDVL